PFKVAVRTFGSAPSAARHALHLCLLVVLAVAAGWAVPPAAAGPAAAGPVFPPYVYVAVSGPASYDVMRNVAGKETRLSRVAVAGVGLSDVVARMAPDGQHVAVRVSGERTGGSSLRIIDTSTSRAITVTLSRSDNAGIGTFAWSADSRQLAYTVASPQRATADAGAGALWVVGADARGAKRLSAPSNARLIAWSPDSSGLYFVREMGDAKAPVDLLYLPLTGASSVVLHSSTGGAQYSMFAVSSAAVAEGAPGAAQVAMLASGDLAGLPNAAAPPANVPHSRPARRLVNAEAPAVVSGDGKGTYKPLPDAGEDYTVLAWNPTGTHLLFSGGKSGAVWYADVATGKRWRLPASLNGLAPISWSTDNSTVILASANGAATRLITLDTANGKILRTRAVGTAPKASTPVKDLAVPYISQIWHTGVSFNGNWACGPTSVAMVLAYYGRLEPWPFAANLVRPSASSRLQSHAAGGAAGKPDLMDGQLYGQYVTTAFTYKGRSFNASGADASGRRAQGLYGTIVGNAALAHWESMIDVLGLYNVSTNYVPITWASITAQLDKGYPVVLGTTLTTSGHILVARGYTANGYLLVNDPYGNRFGAAGYGANDGEHVAYAWKTLPIKLAMVTRGTITPPAVPSPTPTATATAVPQATATAMATATPAAPASHGAIGGP
ncbi:MAG TPA: C39 family peptidase, partial [Chloroflexia bacterium]|nr:C39 family peptidase [Chloroflexia bacterium]